MIHLVDVYDDIDRWIAPLYELLTERDETVNISHKAMPRPIEHKGFVYGHPYQFWWMIALEDVDEYTSVGTCYLTRQNEIGIQIFKAHQRQGYASAALAILLERFKDRRLLANVNPQNEKSIALFRRYGFQVCQYTYAKEPQ